MSITGVDISIAFFTDSLDLVGYCVIIRRTAFVRAYNYAIGVGKVITYFLENSFKLVAGFVHNSLLDLFKDTYGSQR